MKSTVARALAVLIALAVTRAAAAAEYLLPANGDNVIGRNGTDVALREDTLFDIARRNGVVSYSFDGVEKSAVFQTSEKLQWSIAFTVPRQDDV